MSFQCQTNVVNFLVLLPEYILSISVKLITLAKIIQNALKVKLNVTLWLINWFKSSSTTSYCHGNRCKRQFQLWNMEILVFLAKLHSLRCQEQQLTIYAKLFFLNKTCFPENDGFMFQSL